MDHVRFSGTEPSSVILSQRSSIKVGNNDIKQIKQAEEKKGQCNKPKNIPISNNFKQGKF